MADIDNVKIAEQFNRLFSERRVLAAAVTREMRNQLELSTQIATIVNGVKPEEIADKLAAVSKAMESLGGNSKEAGDQAEKAMNAAAAGSKGALKGFSNVDKQVKVLTTKFPALKSAAAGAFDGLIQGLKNIVAVGSTAVGMAGGLAGGIFKIAKSIAAIPLKIFRGLIDLASEFSGDTSFLQALENLRKEFGNFKEDVSKNVIGAFKTAQAGVTGTGLSTFRVLGTFAQQLEYFTEVAKGAGAQMHEFGTEIAQNAGKVIAFDKGLGIGSDHLKAYMDRAKTFGTNLQAQFLNTANYSLQMGEAFGISQKVLAKDISAMMKDVKNFGSLTQKEMSVASVYTRKLGFEVKNLLGLVDKFDTFEDSANAAAQMSQAFGTATDAFKLMQEQDPAKRMDMLRKSMQAAGKTTENMSRQELKLLAQTSGLDEATAKLAFSAKNQGISYDQIQKKASEAENAPLKQAQALEKLAASIERVVMQGQMFKGGFIDQFLHGFQIGIKSSPAFVGAIMSIRTALIQTMHMGVAVGKMFVKTFAGGSIEAIFNGIKEAFQGWDKLMAKTKDAFASFFVDFDIGKLVKNFQNIFIGHFSAKGSAGSSMMNGLKGLFDGLAKVGASGIRFFVENLTSGVSKATAFLKAYLAGPEAFAKMLQDGSGKLKGGFLGMISPLLDVFKDKTLWMNLFNALTGALSGIWDLVKSWVQGPTFQKIIGKIAPTMLSMLVVPSVVRGAAGAAFGSLASVLLGGGKDMAGKVLSGAAKEGSSNPIGPGMMTGLFGNPYTAAAALVAAAGVAGTGFSKGVQKFQSKLVADASVTGDKAEKQIGASIAGVIQVLSFGKLGDEAAYEMAKNFSKFADEMFKKIDSIFGPDIGKGIKVRLMTQLDFLTHFGDLIRSVFGGDAVGAAKSIGNMLADVFKIAIQQIQFVFLELPTKLINWLIPAINDLSAYLEKSMNPNSGSGSVWENVKPVLAKIGGDLLPPLWESMKSMFATMFVKLPPVIGRLVLTFSAWMGQMLLDVMKDVGKMAWNGVVESLLTLAEKTSGLFGAKMKEQFDKLRNLLKFKSDDTTKSATEQTSDAMKKMQDAQKASPSEAPKAATAVSPVSPNGDQSDKMMKAQQTLDGLKSMQELQKIDIQKTIDSTSAKLESINMEKLNTGLLDRVSVLSDTMTKLADNLDKSSSNVSARLAPTLKATQDIIASVRELDNILASGDATRISVTKNLSKFANNSGLGGNDKYTIQNKGIQINLDLKVVMNAEELEESLVLRNKSIIKDSIKQSLSLTDDQLRDKIRNH